MLEEFKVGIDHMTQFFFQTEILIILQFIRLLQILFKTILIKKTENRIFGRKILIYLRTRDFKLVRNGRETETRWIVEVYSNCSIADLFFSHFFC